MVFLVLGRSVDTISKGLGACYVSHEAWHCWAFVGRQYVGSHRSSLESQPSWRTILRWCLAVLFRRCWGVHRDRDHLLLIVSSGEVWEWNGVWTAYDNGPSLKCSLTGFPVIDGSGWWGHWLNADDENAPSSQAFSFWIFMVICLKGICFGLVGVLVLLGQLHSSSEFTAAVFLLENDSHPIPPLDKQPRQSTRTRRPPRPLSLKMTGQSNDWYPWYIYFCI